MFKFLSVSALLFVFVSCNKQSEELVSYEMIDNYHGLFIGNTSFYNVRYVFHDDQVDRHDTIHFKMKSIVEDTFRNNESLLTYKIHRYRWNDTIASWVNYKIIAAYLKNGFYIENEDNYSVKKLQIPYVYGLDWNSSSYNIEDTLHFRFKNFYKSFSLNSILIDSVIQVKQQLYQTYVDHKRKSEYFASRKGMVYKEFKDLKIKKGDTLKIDKGEEWKFSLYQFISSK